MAAPVEMEAILRKCNLQLHSQGGFELVLRMGGEIPPQIARQGLAGEPAEAGERTSTTTLEERCRLVQSGRKCKKVAGFLTGNGKRKSLAHAIYFATRLGHGLGR